MTSDLEIRVRATLEQHARPAALRRMPPETVRRVRIRRAGAVLCVAIAISAALAGVVTLAQVAPGTGRRPASVVTVAIPSPPEPGTTYVTPAPFSDLEAGEWPQAVEGGVEVPYIDREVGEDLDKHVLRSGHVETTVWSVTAFLSDGDPCAELFLGETGDYGGFRVCGRDGAHSELLVGGASFGAGPVTAYLGITAPNVDRVVLRLSGGSSRRVDLVDGPRGIDAGFFVVFVPNEVDGEIVVQTGVREVGAESLCVGPPASVESVAACGSGLVWAASAVGSDPH
ncbi:MAG: hypothetical protein ACRDHU_13945 [Actinomycetota bacterium]